MKRKIVLLAVVTAAMLGVLQSAVWATAKSGTKTEAKKVPLVTRDNFVSLSFKTLDDLARRETEFKVNGNSALHKNSFLTAIYWGES